MNNKKVALGILSTSLLLATACGPKEQESNNVPSETNQEENKVQEITYMDVWTHIGKKGVDNVLPKDFKAIKDVEKIENDDGTTDYIYSFKDGVLRFVIKEDISGEESVVLLNLKKNIDGQLEEEGFNFINLEKDDDEDIPLNNNEEEDDEELDNEDDTEEEDNEDEDDTEEESEENTEEEENDTENDTEESEEEESQEETKESKDKETKKDTKKDKEEKDDKKAEEKKPLDKKEGEKALAKAKDYIKMMHMSKKRLEEQLSSKHGEGFSEAAVQYALDNLKINWKENALKKAKYYKEDMKMSDEEILEQLTSKNGEAFNKEEAEYAIKHLND